jgi:uncharacterized membrane protein
MAAPSDRWHPLARAEDIEYDRVLFFSDAIFAIAITLVVVDLQVPDGPVQSGQQLRETVPQMVGFAISFAVIGLFWIGHHGLFRHIKGLNRPLILLRTLMTPAVFLVSVPVAFFRPVPAKYLWLLLIPAGAVLRRLEPPEAEQAAASGGDQLG